MQLFAIRAVIGRDSEQLATSKWLFLNEFAPLLGTLYVTRNQA